MVDNIVRLQTRRGSQAVRSGSQDDPLGDVIGKSSNSDQLGITDICRKQVTPSDFDLLLSLLLGLLPDSQLQLIVGNLLYAFESIDRVVAACPDRLSQIDGIGPSIIFRLKMVEALGQRMARACIIEKPLLSCWTELVSYLRVVMAHQEIECLRILYLDKKNRLIIDEEVSKGTVDHVPAYPREIMKRIILLNASAIILVHNHPSGDCNPSSQDISMTHTIKKAISTIGVSLHDHVIIGRFGEVSFRSEGLL